MTRADRPSQARPASAAGAPNAAASPPNAAAMPLIAVYAFLEERARAAKTLPELSFSMVNESWQLAGFRQAFLWRCDTGRVRLMAVSGLAQLAEDSPFTVWLKRTGRILEERVRDEPEFVTVDDLPEALAEGWREWMPSLLLVEPVLSPTGERVALLAFACDDAPEDPRQELLLRLMGAYGHAWAALAPRRRHHLGGLRRWIAPILLLAALAALALPVRLSVLAPAEVIGLDALAIAAPMDGVIKEFHVQPNQAVQAGQLLFTLDDTTLRNRRQVAGKQLQVARADALAAQQKSFDNEASRAELASLNGKVAERQAELAYVDDLLKRIEVRSPGAGVVVFGDINDWQGKPVVTGERVALLADPAQPGVLIWLPVSDAINIETGAQVRLYLQVAPLEPLAATLSQTSYQAANSPDGISAYRLRARFDAPTEEQLRLARIGLKGTAKLYGERAPLGYYLFRRPLAALREWTGW